MWNLASCSSNQSSSWATIELKIILPLQKSMHAAFLRKELGETAFPGVIVRYSVKQGSLAASSAATLLLEGYIMQGKPASLLAGALTAMYCFRDAGFGFRGHLEVNKNTQTCFPCEPSLHALLSLLAAGWGLLRPDNLAGSIGLLSAKHAGFRLPPAVIHCQRLLA